MVDQIYFINFPSFQFLSCYFALQQLHTCASLSFYSEHQIQTSRMDQNIEIIVRIKPCSMSSFPSQCGWDSYSIQVTDRNQFTFDSVIEPDATQESVFDKVGTRIIANILEGYNGSIFTYGQTGSGKTFTMTGDSNSEGLVHKCLKKLWNCVNSSEFFQIKLGYFEIYNQIIKDLLGNKQNLLIREHAKNGFYVEGLTEVIVESYQQFEHLLKYGIAARTVKETKINNTSSRSHSVLEVNLSYKKKQGSLTVLKHAKLTFIDLAGSQKQKQTQVEGQRLKQAANINKSLSTLSLVISKLSQQSQRKSGSVLTPVHIPFRNSVLTKILKNSLTGKSRIMIVCTVSLQQRFIDETISTLRFAQMAKSIKMKINKNEQQFDGTKERLFEEFAQVKQKFFELEEASKQFRKENEQLKRQNAFLKDQLETKEAEINQLQVSMECMKIESRQLFQSQAPYQNLGMSQSAQASQNFNNYRRTQLQQSQMIKTNLQCQNSQSSNLPFYYQPQAINNYHQLNQYSQASIFTSQISQSQSKRGSFFTIAEEDSKAQNSGSQSKQNNLNEFEQRIITLQIELEKLKVENEFMKFYRDLQEHQIAELIKNNVFLAAKESEIEQAHNLFAELIRNQEFSHAQIKFLEFCLSSTQKDKLALELSEQEKMNQKKRFNQTVEKIKDLLKSYTENKFPLNEYSINQDLSNQRTEERFMSKQKRQRSSDGNIFAKNTQFIEKTDSKFDELDKEVQIDKQQIWQEGLPQKREPKSEKKQRLTQEYLPVVKESQTPMNNRQRISQTVFFGEATQMINQVSYQSASQLPMFMQDTRSLLSQTTNRLSNNELQYLKKDYQKMSTQVKELKESVQKYKIQLLQRDSLLEEKAMELDEALGRLKLIEEDLDIKKELLELERRKKEEMEMGKKDKKESKKWECKFLEKEEEVRHLKQYIGELERKHESLCGSLKLKNQQLQLSLKSISLGKYNLQNSYQANISDYNCKIQSLKQELSQTNIKKEQLQIGYGVLNSQNILLTERYNYLKSCLNTNNSARKPPSPQKIYSKNLSYFSLSQPSQNPLSNHHIKNNTQLNPSLSKPKQINENQCIQAIQNKTQEYMYQAAYYFYKKCSHLQQLKNTFQQQLIELQERINSLDHTHQQEIHQINQTNQQKIHQIDHDLISAKRSALVHEQAVVDLKKEILDLKQQIYNKDKLIDQLSSKQKRTNQYSQFLQTKLKQKNQKQLQAKQKAHNLSAQLRDNSLTPIYSQKNHRFNWSRKSFINDESEDSLVYNGDTPRNLANFFASQSRKISNGERTSIEKVRGEEINQVDVLRQEIQEASNEQTSVNHVRIGENQYLQREKQYEPSGTESIVSRTLTNQKLTEQEKIQENLSHFNLNRDNYKIQGIYGKNLNKQRTKAASTKGHLPFDMSSESIEGDNLFMSKK